MGRARPACAADGAAAFLAPASDREYTGHRRKPVLPRRVQLVRAQMSSSEMTLLKRPAAALAVVAGGDAVVEGEGVQHVRASWPTASAGSGTVEAEVSALPRRNTSSSMMTPRRPGRVMCTFAGSSRAVRRGRLYRSVLIARARQEDMIPSRSFQILGGDNSANVCGCS